MEKNAPVDPRVPFGLARGKNIFVIQVESLQPDVLGMKVDGQEITPRLNRFMRESIVFDRCFDQTHMGRSSDADFCGYNSLHPVGRGSMVLRYPGTQRDALPQHLQRAGYHTFISSGMDGGFWNMNWMHRRYGFVERAYVSDYTRGDEFTLGLHDQSFFLQALKRVDQLPQPFLAHFITLTSHHPYCFIRDKEPGLRLDSLYPTQAYEYLQTMHYVDAAIGQFLDGLKVRGLYDDSVILIYGDHDGFLPPHQIALLDGPFHKPWGFKGLDRVAMMLRLPGGEVIERRQTTTGHLDIAPTLLHLSGMPREGTFFLGNNLFRDNGNAVIPFRDGSFADQRYLFTSVDGGWAGGRAFRLDTRAEVDVNLCAESFREARQRLRRSDLIIQGDLIPRLRERAAPQ